MCCVVMPRYYVIFSIIDAWVIKSLPLCTILLFSPMKAYNDFVYENFINFIERHFFFNVHSKVVIHCNALIASNIFNCFLYCSCKVLC